MRPTGDVTEQLPETPLNFLMKCLLWSSVLLLMLPAFIEAQDSAGAPTSPPEPEGPPAPASAAETDAASVADAPAPAGTGNVVSTAAAHPNFSTFVEALVASGLAEKLQAGGPYTIFAPTNEAFKELPKGSLAELLKPVNREKLVCILRYHIVLGERSTSSLGDGPLKTDYGLEAEIAHLDSGQWSIDGATLVQTDMQASNGVIHGIDTVIAPEK